jgi:YVTN family beta-propeller protein
VSDPSATFAYLTADTTVASVSAAGLLIAHGGGTTIISISAHGDTLPLPLAVYGHPSGQLATTLPVDDRPEGIAISATGLVYVTRYDFAGLSSFVLPALTPMSGAVVPATALDVSFSPQGDLAFVANRDQQSIAVVNVVLGSVIDSIPVGGHPLRVLTHPTAGVVFATTDLDSAYKISTSTHSILARSFLPSATSGSGPLGIAISPDGLTLYVCGGLGNEITTLSVATFAITDTMNIAPSFFPSDIAISPSGDTLYVASSGGIELYDLASHAFLTGIPLPGLFAIKMTPDSTALYASADDRIYVVDRASLIVADTVDLVSGPARRLAFDKYGKVAMVANESGFVHLIQ